MLSLTEQLPVNLVDWTENDVFHWLISIGIPEKLAHAFREEAIDGNVLAIYKSDEMLHDFQKHGLKIGHLRKILHQRKQYQDCSDVPGDTKKSSCTSDDNVDPHVTKESKNTNDTANTTDQNAKNTTKKPDTIQHLVKQPEITGQSDATTAANCKQLAREETEQISHTVQRKTKDLNHTQKLSDTATHPNQHVTTKPKNTQQQTDTEDKLFSESETTHFKYTPEPASMANHPDQTVTNEPQNTPQKTGSTADDICQNVKQESEPKKPPPDSVNRLKKHTTTEDQNTKQPDISERDDSLKNATEEHQPAKKQIDDDHIHQQDIKEFNGAQQRAKNVQHATNVTSQKTSTLKPNFSSISLADEHGTTESKCLVQGARQKHLESIQKQQSGDKDLIKENQVPPNYLRQASCSTLKFDSENTHFQQTSVVGRQMDEQVSISDDTPKSQHKLKGELKDKSSPTIPISHIRNSETVDSTRDAKQVEEPIRDENEGNRQERLPVNKVQPMTKHPNTQILLSTTEKLNRNSTKSIMETANGMQVQGNSAKSTSTTNARHLDTNETRLRELLFGNQEDQPSFGKDYYPILVANKPSQALLDADASEKDQTLSFVRDVPWKVVFDVYANSKSDGLCGFYGAQRTPVLQLSDEWDSIENTIANLENTLWLFCNGRTDDPDLLVSDPMNLRNWNENRSHEVENAITFFSKPEIVPSARAVIIFLILSDEDIDILGDIFRKFSSAFKSVANITCLIDDDRLYTRWVEELKRWYTETELQQRSLVGVSLVDVNTYIKRLGKVNQTKPHKLPKGTAGQCILEEHDVRRWTDVYVIDKNECDNTDMNKENPDFENFCRDKELQFFKGGTVDWWNFALTDGSQNHVLRRSVHQQLHNTVEDTLKCRGVTGTRARTPILTITIFHQPGSGATTIGRHILWDFHRKYRCVVVNRVTQNTAKQIEEIYMYQHDRSKNEEPQPILLLVELDNSEVFDLVSDLAIQARNLDLDDMFCVILHSRRVGDPDDRIADLMVDERSRAISLKHKLIDRERRWFQSKYEELEHRSVSQADSPDSLIGFMVMKEECNPEYVSQLVSQVMEDLNEKEFYLLKYTTLVSKYGDGSAIPVSCCDEFMDMKPQKSKHDKVLSFGLVVPGKSSRQMLWEKCLSAGAQMLMIKTSASSGRYLHLSGIKSVHRSVADEILRLLEEQGATLKGIVEEFLTSQLMKCRSHGKNELNEMVAQMLIRRKRKDQGDSEDTLFSELIEDLSRADQGAPLAVFDQAFAILESPIVAQQAARLCYVKFQDFQEAHRYIDKALGLNPQNSYMWDTKGQIFKSEMVGAYGQYQGGKKVLPAQDGCQLISLACKAAENFRKSQQCAEIEAENNYAGYFNELNITFRLLHIMQVSVSPFRQCVDGLDHMRQYLVTDYEPDNLLCWRDYHPSMKKMRENVEACLECIDDMVTFCKEGRTAEMSVSKFNEQKRQRHYFIQQYERFFGELGHMKGIIDAAEARRREVVGLGMHTFQQIFELVQTSRQNSKKKLKETRDLLVKNTPQTSFDLRIRIFISFALSTLDDTDDQRAEDVIQNGRTIM